VIVGSESSEERSAPVRARRPTDVAHPLHQLVQGELVRIPDRWGDEATAPHGDGHAEVDGRRRPKLVIDPLAVHLRHLAGGEDDCAEGQRGEQKAFTDRTPVVGGAQPVLGRRDVERGAEIIVRNFPLRAGHERARSLAHRVQPVRPVGTAGGGCGGGAAVVVAATVLAGWAAVARTSRICTAPPGPEPWTVARSMPSSAARRRAYGLARRAGRRPPPAPRRV